MREIHGDMFAYLGRMKFHLFITTNGFIKNDGYAVLGRGNAARAVTVLKEEQGLNLPDLVGKSLKLHGNNVSRITTQLYTFPVKTEEWWRRARRKIIKRSVEQLEEIIKKDKENNQNLVYIIPRPGCGNGELNWEKDVKPLMKHLPDNVWVICAWDDPNWKKEDKKNVTPKKRHSRRR